MSNETENELTVAEIIDWLGESTWESTDDTNKAFVAIDSLLKKVETIERDTAEKCAEIAEMRQCNCFVLKKKLPETTCPACRSAKFISAHFNLGETP